MTTSIGNMSFEEGLNHLGISLEELKQFRYQLANAQKKVVKTEKMSLDAAIDDYLNVLKATKAESTFIKYRGILMDFLIFMHERWDKLNVQERNIDIINKAAIELFLARINSRNGRLNSTTFNNKRAVIAAFLSHLFHNGYIDHLPTKQVRRKYEGKKDIRFLDKDEQTTVLNQALSNKETGTRDFTIIYLCIMCGFRRMEVAYLKISNIDFKNRRIHVLGKGGKERSVRLRSDVEKVLQNYLLNERNKAYVPEHCEDWLFLNQKPQHTISERVTNDTIRLSESAMEKMVTRVFRRCGIEDGAMHRLRHTFAVNALNSGMNIVEIMEMLGHEDIYTTIKYLRLRDDDILEKMERNFPLAFVSARNLLDIAKGKAKEKLLKLLQED